MSRPFIGVLLASAVLLGGELGAQMSTGCVQCHGELEFLRQHTLTLDEARALYTPNTTLGGSAHADIGCSECHDGFARYPHQDRARSESCAACHEEAHQALTSGTHGGETDVQCTSCHGLHDIVSISELESASNIAGMNQECLACHPDNGFAPSEAHADSVLCSGCHAPHATSPITGPEAWTFSSNQGVTCGVCHDSISVRWQSDAHGAVVGGGEPAEVTEMPACTGCHGAHPMPSLDDPEFAATLTEACSSCHEDYAETYLDSYHGKAASLGREDVAQCAACHTSHAVYPTSDSRSAVSEGVILETCRSCHPEARPSFVEFQPHSDPFDPEGDPRIFWVNRLMLALLASVFGVFGIHSALWLVRSALDGLQTGGAAGTDGTT